jgi:light-regulated signal transduction histidine kinase (bacteriophytochrome)
LEQHNFSEKSKDYFNRIQEAANRMRSLINDLLSYSRTNSEEGKFISTDLNILLTDVRNELKETFEAKYATLEYSQLPRLKVIPFQFHQLLVNLLSNALKFSKDGVAPHVVIKADMLSGDRIQNAEKDPLKIYHHITMSDNGIGFDPTYNTKIFEVFQRLHGRNEYEGTGVGLAICRKIMQNHGGFIYAEAQVNEGATFHIYLPAEGVSNC